MLSFNTPKHNTHKHKHQQALDFAPLERVEPLFYRHAHALLLHAPVPALASFVRHTPGLDPARLLPAIVHLIAHCDATLAAPAATEASKAQAAEARKAAVRYLEHCVSVEGGLGGLGEEGGLGLHGGRGAVGPSLSVGAGRGGLKPSSSSSGGGGGAAPAVLYNYLLQLYAQAAAGAEGQEAADERLLAFLQAHTSSSSHTGGGGGTMLLDLAGSLRVCARHGRTRACVHLYSCMGMYEVGGWKA